MVAAREGHGQGFGRQSAAAAARARARFHERSTRLRIVSLLESAKVCST